MFVYSVRASTVKFFAVIAITLAVVISAIAIGNSTAITTSAAGGVELGGIKTNEDRLEFIAQFGIEVTGEPKETVSFAVPESFDSIISGYNEIQKSQGLDISKYKNKKVTRYTYEIDGYGDYNGPVFVNLIVYRNTVVACDVSSADPSGFVEPLIKLNG